MKAETYVRRIARKLKCSGRRRAEFKRQLLSDISFREENGENLECILESMGEPAEFAREFNQNLPPGEKRRHTIKNVCILLLAILACLAMLAGIAFWMLPKGYPMGYSGFFSQEEVEAQAKTVIRLLDEEAYGALKEISIEELHDVFSKEAMARVKEQVCDDWGAFESYGKVYSQELKQMGKCYALVQIHVSYERASILYTLTFEPDGNLAGLYMR